MDEAGDDIKGAPRDASGGERDAEVTGEEQHAIKLQPGWRLRRSLATTAVYAGIYLLGLALLHVPGVVVGLMILLLPPYVITLAIVLRRPRPKTHKKRALSRYAWQAKLMTAILGFILIYLPFTFFSDRIIPYAPVVEYLFFALMIYVLYRIIGRSVGVSSSMEALPPPTHRTHKQVIGAIDDPHYQRTVMLNYNFLERGKGSKGLAQRLGRLLESYGVPAKRQEEILEPLDAFRGGPFHFLRPSGSSGRDRARRQREQALQSVMARIQGELEVQS